MAVVLLPGESWETMQAENIGYLFWGGVGTGKSYLAACIANALMEKEVAEARPRLCSPPLRR